MIEIDWFWVFMIVCVICCTIMEASDNHKDGKE